jgi:hypothetical protein
MPIRAKFSLFRWFSLPRDAAVRIGIYSGVSLSLVFAAWLFIANRVPFLEPLAMERNIIAAALLAVLACVPLIRFYRAPMDLLLSGFLAWGLFAVTYQGFCFKFRLLEGYYTAFHVFVLGAISYLVFATLFWIATIIWTVHTTSSSGTHR